MAIKWFLIAACAPTQCVSIFSGNLGESKIEQMPWSGRNRNESAIISACNLIKPPLPGIHETGATQK